jgi:small neutral amino acid transporter SnatA (MarC family)
VTHVINYILSIRRLLKISGIRIPLAIPLLTAVGTIAAVFGAGFVSQPVLRAFAFLLLFLCLLILLGVLNKDDVLWLKGLLQKK